MTGIVIDLAAYLAGVQAVNILVHQRDRPGPAVRRGAGGPVPRPALPGAALWLCVFLALYAAGLGYAAARPPAAPQYADLAAWLRAHHLAAGLSGYRQANIVTLETGGAVTLRPVTPGADGRLARYRWNAERRLVRPGRAHRDLPGPRRTGTAGGTGAPGAPTWPAGVRPAGHRHVRPARRELPVSGV